MPEIYPSSSSAYRARAEFRFCIHDNILHYAMSAAGKNQRIRILRCPILHPSLQSLMPPLLESLRANEILWHKIYACNLLCTLQGEAIITLIYHKNLDSKWQQEAHILQERLNAILHSKIHLIGRSKKTKIILSKDCIQETLTLFAHTQKARTLHYLKQESRFSQPNPSINIKMLEFISTALEKHYQGATQADLLELYCGSGNFSIALSPFFRSILATEVVKSASMLLQKNLALNHITHITNVRLNALESMQALRKQRIFYRLRNINLDSFCFDCVLIDPPRSGIAEVDILHFLQDFRIIIYISCNPSTLLRDMRVLHQSHEVLHFGIFDQFPHTAHAECILILKRR